MQRKLNLVIILVATMLLMSMAFVSAATDSNVSIGKPVASGTLSNASAVVNCTLAAGYESDAYYEARFYLKSASLTANTTISLMNVSGNLTDNFFVGLVNTTRLEDGNDYQITCTLTNGTNNISSVRSGITIDNTAPSAPTTLTPASNTIDTDGSVDFSATVTGTQTTACTLYFDGTNPGNPSYAMTHSANTCTLTIASMPDQSYKWYVQASDGTNTSASSDTSTVTPDVKTSAGKTAALLTQQGITSTGGATLSVASDTGINKPVAGLPVWIWALLVIIVIAVVIARRKK